MEEERAQISEVPSDNPAGDEEVSDSELDQLLDESLGDFGKHVPQAVLPQSPIPQPPDTAQQPPTKTTPPSNSQPRLPNLDSAGMEDMFSAEFAAEAEAQLDEAMKILSDENPALWQQFESFTKSMGLDGVGAGPVPPASGASSKGESSVDANSGTARGEGKGEGEPTRKRGDDSSLEQKLEDTMKRLQENSARVGPEGSHLEGLGDMLGKLDLGSEEGEDHFMKMMHGMMSTLLSKEVLYPSLVDLCKQYPDWLASHRGEISEEDYQRYSKQLEVMKAICGEFENPSEGEGAKEEGSSSEKILHLMQQLQQYGQPPEDMAGENMQEAGIPPGLLGAAAGGDPKNCSVM